MNIVLGDCMRISRKVDSLSQPFHPAAPSRKDVKNPWAAVEDKIYELSKVQRKAAIEQGSRTTKSFLPDDKLMAELTEILQLQATQIEKEMGVLEKSKTHQEAIDALSESESWASWIVDLTSTTNDAIKDGLEFLKEVLPHQILSPFPNHGILEKVSQLTTLGTAFLTALELGLDRLSTIYKTKILQQSEHVLQEMKLGSLRQAGDPVELEKKRKSIAELEKRVRQQKEKLAEEQVPSTISSAYSILYLASLPLAYFPTEKFEKFTKMAASGATWVLSILNVLYLAWDVKKTSQDSKLFNELKEANLILQPAINGFIQSSGDLLKKRKAILDQKLVQLKSEYSNVRGNIEKLKEAAFVRDMQKLFWSEVQNPHCSAEEIREVLQAWGFYHPTAASAQTRELIENLEIFARAKTIQSPSTDILLEEQQALIQAFHQWIAHPLAMSEHFQKWFHLEEREHLDELLHSYADHQETIELTTKNALKAMIQKKHEVEERFVNFNFMSSWTSLAAAVVTLTLTATLAILALLSLQVGGVGVILLALTYGSLFIDLGLWGASYALAYREKPNVTHLLSLQYQANRMWTGLRASVSKYYLLAKERKLLDVAKVLYHLQHLKQKNNSAGSDYQKALQEYQKAKKEFEECQDNTDRWKDQLERLETAINEKSWQDFVEQASLKMSKDSLMFDTLRALQEALQACDLKLLSQETKQLLNVQLGIDLKALQEKLSAEPDTIRDALQGFFILDDDAFMDFIKEQKALNVRQQIA